MDAGRETRRSRGKVHGNLQPEKKNSGMPMRGLARKDLGGIIFGCTNSTMKECMEKKLFGLHGGHFAYIKKVRVGLPLFLFNYNSRTLHGIFGAASRGQMNIDPHGWTSDSSGVTKFPAQVRVSVKLQCQPISERNFKPIIAGNYYNDSHFFFELDHAQVKSLISLFEARACKGSVLPKIHLDESESKNELQSGANADINLGAEWTDEGGSSFEAHCNTYEGRHMNPSVPEGNKFSEGVILDDSYTMSEVAEKLDQALDSKEEEEEEEEEDTSSYSEKSSTLQHDQVCKVPNVLKDDDSLSGNFDNEEVLKLRQKVLEQDNRIGRLEEQQFQFERTIEQLCDQVKVLASKLTRRSNQLPWNLNVDLRETIFLLGGRDENGWIPNLDGYSPFRDNIISLAPMPLPRSLVAVACLSGVLYVTGGTDYSSSRWFDTVESYDPASNSWSTCPSLTCEKGYIAGAALQGKLFVLGGLGAKAFSDVEMYDPNLGKWIVTGSLLQERFSHSAVEFNGALYVAGGHDKVNYLQTVERYDPREARSVRLKGMSTKRGCHCLAVLKDRIYAVGGCDGDNYLSSVELFDPRVGSWVMAETMKSSRGCAATAVLGDGLYAIGGISQTGAAPLDSVECFKDGQGWQYIRSRCLGKRGLHSAAVMLVDY